MDNHSEFLGSTDPTYADMALMQQCFDMVWKNFVTEGNPLSEGERGCMYRDPHGHKCAIGVLIPDDEYVSSIEGTSLAYDLVNSVPSIMKLIDAGLMGFMVDLQVAHDKSTYNKNTNIQNELHAVSKRYNLTVPGAT